MLLETCLFPWHNSQCFSRLYVSILPFYFILFIKQFVFGTGQDSFW